MEALRELLRERRKVSALRPLILGILFIIPVFSVSAYDGNTTHPALTRKIGEVYNNLYNGNLSADDIAAMAEGSVREDISPRWINHFYDPTTGQGRMFNPL